MSNKQARVPSPFGTEAEAREYWRRHEAVRPLTVVPVGFNDEPRWAFEPPDCGNSGDEGADWLYLVGEFGREGSWWQRVAFEESPDLDAVPSSAASLPKDQWAQIEAALNQWRRRQWLERVLWALQEYLDNAMFYASPGLLTQEDIESIVELAARLERLDHR